MQSFGIYISCNIAPHTKCTFNREANNSKQKITTGMGTQDSDISSQSSKSILPLLTLVHSNCTSIAFLFLYIHNNDTCVTTVHASHSTVSSKLSGSLQVQYTSMVANFLPDILPRRPRGKGESFPSQRQLSRWLRMLSCL